MKIGHSCAAVTHQSRPPPVAKAAGQSQSGLNPVKARGEAAGEGLSKIEYHTGPYAESEYLPAESHASDTIARVGCENFIARMKRESSRRFAEAREVTLTYVVEAMGPALA